MHTILYVNDDSCVGLPRVPKYPTGTRVINYPGNFLLPGTTRNSERIWPYSSPRSSKVIDLGVNGKPICDFY